MQMTLTTEAAKDLGRALRFIRQARSLTLRDVARGAGLSAQYVQNIERAQRTTVSEEAYMRLARPLGLPESVIADLLLRARVQSALAQRGLAQDQVGFIWRGVEQRLGEVGFDLQTDLTKIVVDIIT